MIILGCLGDHNLRKHRNTHISRCGDSTETWRHYVINVTVPSAIRGQVSTGRPRSRWCSGRRPAIAIAILGGGFKYFWNFHPYLGKISNLTNIFERGWNHQLVFCFQSYRWCCALNLMPWTVLYTVDMFCQAGDFSFAGSMIDLSGFRKPIMATDIYIRLCLEISM